MTLTQTTTKHFLQTNGIKMKALEWPSQQAATPAVLLHGLTSCAETWSLVAPALAHDRPVYALDLRGHGETDKPDEGYDPDTVVQDIVGAFAALGIQRAHLAGHSWGCGLAVRLAASYPDRVQSLGLVDGGFGGRPQVRRSPEELEAMLCPLEVYRTVDTYLAEVRRSLHGRWTPDIEAIALTSIYRNDDGSVRECLDREHQKLILTGGSFQDISALYPTLKCPILMVPAENVTSSPERREARRAAIAEAAAQIPVAQVHWVPETVHDIQLHKPDILTDLLRNHFASGS